MDIYDKMCFTISSADGRRGAQMGVFDISHPDVKDFILAKREDGRLRQFNLSLLISDDFINAVKNNTNWPLNFPLTQKECLEDNIDLSDSSTILFKENHYHSDHALYITINDILLNQGSAEEIGRPCEIFVNSKNMEFYAWIVANDGKYYCGCLN